MTSDTDFRMAVPSDIDPGQTLLVGLSSPGLAGLTAVDHLVKHLESEEIGHVHPEALPAITPFEEGGSATPHAAIQPDKQRPHRVGR